VRQSLLAQVPFPKRFGHAAEFASFVCHIFENNMLNGCVLRLDGAARWSQNSPRYLAASRISGSSLERIFCKQVSARRIESARKNLATASFHPVVVCQFMVPAAKCTRRREEFHCKPGDSLLHELPLDDFLAVAEQRALNGRMKPTNELSKLSCGLESIPNCEPAPAEGVNLDRTDSAKKLCDYSGARSGVFNELPLPSCELPDRAFRPGR